MSFANRYRRRRARKEKETVDTNNIYFPSPGYMNPGLFAIQYQDIVERQEPIDTPSVQDVYYPPDTSCGVGTVEVDYPSDHASVCETPTTDYGSSSYDSGGF